MGDILDLILKIIDQDNTNTYKIKEIINLINREKDVMACENRYDDESNDGAFYTEEEHCYFIHHNLISLCEYFGIEVIGKE